MHTLDAIIFLTFVPPIAIYRLTEAPSDPDGISPPLRLLPWTLFLKDGRHTQLVGGFQYVRRFRWLLLRFILVSYLAVAINAAILLFFLFVLARVTGSEFGDLPPIVSIIAIALYAIETRSALKFLFKQRREIDRAYLEGQTREIRRLSRRPRVQKTSLHAEVSEPALGEPHTSEQDRGFLQLLAFGFRSLAEWARYGIAYAIPDEILAPAISDVQMHTASLLNNSAELLYAKFGFDTVLYFLKWAEKRKIYRWDIIHEIKAQQINSPEKDRERACFVLLGFIHEKGYFVLHDNLQHFRERYLAEMQTPLTQRVRAVPRLNGKKAVAARVSDDHHECTETAIAQISEDGTGLFTLGTIYYEPGTKMRLQFKDIELEGTGIYSDIFPNRFDDLRRVLWGVGVSLETPIPEDFIEEYEHDSTR